jgi:phosphatidylglycerophosphatase A
MAPSTENSGAPNAGNKPKFAYAIATALGLGNAPVAPGTFGALAGLVVAIVTHPISFITVLGGVVSRTGGPNVDLPAPPAPWLLLVPPIIAVLAVAALGVWSSTRVADFSGVKDPQFVVIDEVSGMHLTLILGIMPFWTPAHYTSDDAGIFALFSAFSLLNWKYLLLGFVLFRIFDIWKPFPVRQLEKWPRGWGIMADDWMAGVYAAILLQVALHFGLFGKI